ncbi:protein ABHD15-like [Ambystoma mexicanum]|uniref:protein ABHD15-like n=1 Tax=Ambystoma mexicanum TaxID=8296 RepID=UPI0037E95B40
MPGVPVAMMPGRAAAVPALLALLILALLLWSGAVFAVPLLLFVIILVFVLRTSGLVSPWYPKLAAGCLVGPEIPAEPVLTCKPSALASYLLLHCPRFRGPSAPPWPWGSLASLQTAAALLGPPCRGVRFAREYLQLRDGGLVALDWAVSQRARRRRASTNSTAPVLLCIPNSFGRVTRNLTQLCQLALAHGYHPVIFNRRCHNECPLSTIKLQPYGDPCDLREAVQYIHHRHQASRLFAVAESTGAGLLFSYLGECGSSSYMTAAACISPLLCPQAWFEDGCPWFWEKIFLFYQKLTLSRYATVLGEAVSMDEVMGSRSLKELEETLFCTTRTSTSSWESYWEHNDPLRDVDEVAIPLLCICSHDDPIRGSAEKTLPVELFETNPHLFLLQTQHGGHCGFLADSLTGEGWSHHALLDFFKSTLDFFLMEEKHKGLSRRKEGGLGVLSKSIAGIGLAPKSTEETRVCRQDPICTHNIHEIYKWQRSYTR